MWQVLLVCCGFFGGDLVEVRTRFLQVHPEPEDSGPLLPAAKAFQRSPGQARAVVLIHGLHATLTNFSALEPRLHTWQQPRSLLVRRLAACADVYAFAYGQNVSVDRVARLPVLEDNVRELKRIGYQKIVLVGHSAGGLVARQFVEDHPDAGVTAVIQVCTPNAGSAYAKLAPLARREQRVFVASLTAEARRAAAKDRVGKKIPRGVQFLCVVGTRDGLVTCRCQWSADLQAQGIPALTLPLAHASALRSDANARLLCAALEREHRRWTGAEVEAARGPITAGQPYPPPEKSALK